VRRDGATDFFYENESVTPDVNHRRRQGLTTARVMSLSAQRVLDLEEVGNWSRVNRQLIWVAGSRRPWRRR